MESTPVLAPLSVAATSLATAFAAVPDPRRAASVVYPLAAILALAVAALLANHRSVLAIAEWGGRGRPPLCGKRSALRTAARPANRRCSGCSATSTAMPSPPP